MKRDALEALFARAAQGRCFLFTAAGGLLLGAMLTLAGRLYRRGRLWGMAADGLTVLLFALLALGSAFLSGDGLRLYALLGLLLGAALWRSGIQPVLDSLGRALQKLFRRRQE